MIIAVDGPAAAGKGTVARALAHHFGYRFLDTGSLYRMVGLAVLRGGGDPNDRAAAIRAAQTLRPRTYRDEDLRGEDVGKAASIVAVIAEVRSALLGLQREFARKPPGAVLDGRDIGTVVCPDAEVKLYITAAPEVRARRRMLELAERGIAVLPETVLAEIRDRDERDRSRAAAPLVAAADAIVIDTSAMGIEEAVAAAIAAAMNRHHANPRKG
jgi:cytidylate kinase